MKNTVKRRSIYRFALDPVFAAAFIVMVMNDHIFRPSGIAPLVTGKISDFAVLIFLPAAGALASVYVRHLIHLMGTVAVKSAAGKTIGLSRRDALFGVILCGSVFTLIKAWDRFNDVYIAFINGVNLLRPLFPRLTSTGDATDLIALPSLAVSYLVMRKYI